MKKFMVPVTWQMTTMVEVEAENAEEAMHEACGVDLDTESVDSWEYVGDSWEVDEEGIYEVPSKDTENGDFSAWKDMPGGF